MPTILKAIVKLAKDETTHYVFQGTEPIFEKNITTGKIKSFVYALGKHLARVDGVIDDTQAKKYWYVTDHLGSVRAVTDIDGKKVWSADYLAFGTQYGKEGSTEFEELHSFTGKEYDPDTGLYYYNARWYDAELGRFVSEDPAEQGFNWYIYCGNCPLRYTDPDGRWFGPDDVFTGPIDEVAVFGFLAVAAWCGYEPAKDALTELVNIIENIITDVTSKDEDEAWDKVGDNDVIVTDPFGNSIPAKPGERVEGNEDGTHWQKKDAEGKPTGDRYDKGHPKQKDPKAKKPHGHRVGPDGEPITDETGNPHLPANPQAGGLEGSDGSIGTGGIDDTSGVTGGSSGTTGSSIICAELYRQGLMDTIVFEADEEFGTLIQNKYPIVLNGYHLWARPIVKHMKKSKRFTILINTVAKPWTYEMAYLMGRRKNSDLIGKLMMYIGFPFCWFLGFIVTTILYLKILMLIGVGYFLTFYIRRRYRVKSF